MPWQASDAARHVSGLTAHQATVWARVANSVLRSCLDAGGEQSECEGRALRQAASVARRAPVKSIKVGDDGYLDILAIPFGGPFDGKDLDGEYFSERTDLCLDWFPTQRPLLFEHGLDDDVSVAPIGTVDVGGAVKDRAGWWVRAQLDKGSRYWRQVSELLAADEDALFASSAAMPHLVKRARNGEIIRWPWVELSLTPNPANFFAIVQPATAKAHYKAAGLTPPPTIDADETRTYTDLLDRLTEDVGEFTEMTVRLTHGRGKVGRPQMSEPRRTRLADLMARMRDAAMEIEGLLAETEPKQRETDTDTTDSTDAKASAAHAPEPERSPVLVVTPTTPELVRILGELQQFDIRYGPIRQTA